MMLPALILTLVALVLALLRLWAYRGQLLETARVLEETLPESNLCLTVQMSGTAPRRLCRAVNERLESGRQHRQDTSVVLMVMVLTHETLLRNGGTAPNESPEKIV